MRSPYRSFAEYTTNNDVDVTTVLNAFQIPSGARKLRNVHGCHQFSILSTAKNILILQRCLFSSQFSGNDFSSSRNNQASTYDTSKDRPQMALRLKLLFLEIRIIFVSIQKRKWRNSTPNDLKFSDEFKTSLQIKFEPYFF